MSRIGKKPVPVPTGVKVKLQGQGICLEGAKGKLDWEFHPEVRAVHDEQAKEMRIEAPSEPKGKKATKRFSQFQGLSRALLSNMVEGVTQGFRKELDIQGVGYNAKLQGREVVLSIGFCHPVMMKIPEGIEVEMNNPTQIVVLGCDKQQVGQFAANIRAVRPPEPYKGKGIRYRGEFIRTKSGKKFVGGE